MIFIRQLISVLSTLKPYIVISISLEDYELFKKMSLNQFCETFYDRYDKTFVLRFKYRVFSLFLDPNEPKVYGYSALTDKEFIALKKDFNQDYNQGGKQNEIKN